MRTIFVLPCSHDIKRIQQRKTYLNFFFLSTELEETRSVCIPCDPKKETLKLIDAAHNQQSNCSFFSNPLSRRMIYDLEKKRGKL